MNIFICAEISEDRRQKIITSFKEDTFTYHHPLSQEDVDQADAIIGNPSLKLHLNRSSLQALMLNSAGNDKFIAPGVLNDQTILTNASGSYGPAIAEHVLGMIIALNKNFKTYFSQQKDHIWNVRFDGRELYRSTVLIVGLGDIGHHFAKRVKAFDAHVIGINRRGGVPDEFTDELYDQSKLKEVLPRADYVLLCLPETKETIHLFDENMFKLMKDQSVIANVGRGSAIDLNALMHHLDNGHLYGACLDVFEKEPLPADHPLWNYEQVIMTPHASGGYHWDSVQDYYTDLVIRNLRHLHQHEPLENTVDRISGYRKEVKYRK